MIKWQNIYDYDLYFNTILIQNVWVDSNESAYHSVTLNCSKAWLKNSVYEFEQIIYYRNGYKTITNLSVFFEMTTG